MIEQMQTRRAFLATFASASALVLAACGGSKPASGEGGSSTDEKTGYDAENKSAGVMSYEQYMAAEIDSMVVLECFVQGKQSWWENKATIYAADADGAYFIYNAECDEETYAKLEEGTKIVVTGVKSEWSGEVEVVDATIAVSEAATYVSVATNLNDFLGSDDLINFQNQRVAFTGLTIEPSTDPDGKEVAYLYNWDGSGAEGDDLYFNVSDGKATYSFTVESYLCDKDSDVYKAVQALKVGDTVDVEGFLYWYEGANPHIYSVTVA